MTCELVLCSNYDEFCIAFCFLVWVHSYFERAYYHVPWYCIPFAKTVRDDTMPDRYGVKAEGGKKEQAYVYGKSKTIFANERVSTTKTSHRPGQKSNTPCPDFLCLTIRVLNNLYSTENDVALRTRSVPVDRYALGLGNSDFFYPGHVDGEKSTNSPLKLFL